MLIRFTGLCIFSGNLQVEGMKVLTDSAVKEVRLEWSVGAHGGSLISKLSVRFQLVSSFLWAGEFATWSSSWGSLMACCRLISTDPRAACFIWLYYHVHCPMAKSVSVLSLSFDDCTYYVGKENDRVLSISAGEFCSLNSFDEWFPFAFCKHTMGFLNGPLVWSIDVTNLIESWRVGTGKHGSFANCFYHHTDNLHFAVWQRQ